MEGFLGARRCSPWVRGAAAPGAVSVAVTGGSCHTPHSRRLFKMKELEDPREVSEENTDPGRVLCAQRPVAEAGAAGGRGALLGGPGVGGRRRRREQRVCVGCGQDLGFSAIPQLGNPHIVLQPLLLRAEDQINALLGGQPRVLPKNAHGWARCGCCTDLYFMHKAHLRLITSASRLKHGPPGSAAVPRD